MNIYNLSNNFRNNCSYLRVRKLVNRMISNDHRNQDQKFEDLFLHEGAFSSEKIDLSLIIEDIHLKRSRKDDGDTLL